MGWEKVKEEVGVEKKEEEKEEEEEEEEEEQQQQQQQQQQQPKNNTSNNNNNNNNKNNNYNKERKKENKPRASASDLVHTGITAITKFIISLKLLRVCFRLLFPAVVYTSSARASICTLQLSLFARAAIC